ncbi:hypothetical protein MNBD_CHLOROFLEXI01-694 [hydrothermal vent metagenome]|uniref:HTH luxR-type domain-containing protein n=1 Tax=hydrothermal vent metagenome TaxID=652676 RepID=A0A3B0VJX3_9ZZZZ
MAEKGEALSKRELEVLQCVIDGAVNKEIAVSLTISQNTVKVHLRNIYTKLGVSSRTEATTMALQQGLGTLAGVTTENGDSNVGETVPSTGSVQAVPLPEPADATTVAPTESSDPVEQPSPSSFSRQRIGWIGLLVLLLAATSFLAFRIFAEREQLSPTPEPFVETALSDDWLQSRPLPAPRANMALVGNGLNLYLIGGVDAAGITNAVSIYDTSALVWREGAPKPTAVTDVTGAELFGEIYLAGGALADGQPTNVLEVYSPANDSWRIATPLPTAVSGGLLLSDGSFLYLFGGWDGQNYLANAYRFDPANNNWQILPSMSTPRAFVTGGVVKGKLYVIGGYGGERPLTECAAFDLTSNNSESGGSWQPCADTLLPRAGAGGADLLNKLYIFGGGAFGDEAIPYSESYNPDADQWSIVNTPPLSDLPNWEKLGITTVETKIYAVGGLRNSELTTETFVYRPLVYQTFIPIAPSNGSGNP